MLVQNEAQMLQMLNSDGTVNHVNVDILRATIFNRNVASFAAPPIPTMFPPVGPPGPGHHMYDPSGGRLPVVPSPSPYGPGYGANNGNHNMPRPGSGSGSSGRKLCKQIAAGKRCHFGDRCSFSHDFAGGR